MTPDAERACSPLHATLAALFHDARLPTSPAIARQILALIENPWSTAGQFARVIEADPALAARLLRLANSAHYAQQRRVTTIQRAVTVVGLGQLRVVTLGFELVGHLDRLGASAFDLRSFWQQSARRAALARQLAMRVVPSLAEEAFLVGLLQECGVPVLVQGLGEAYAELARVSADDPEAFHREERRRFQWNHVDAIGVLADMWELPEIIADPLVRHHRTVTIGGRSPDVVRLAAVSAFVGTRRLPSDLESAAHDLELIHAARVALRLDAPELTRCLEGAQRNWAQLAPLLEMPDASQDDPTHLLVSANRHLRREAAETEQRRREAEAERDRVRREQVTLRSALGQYREQAARDPLTGVLNRRALVDAATAHLAGARRSDGAVAVMFLDVDDFKRLNDEHGHAAGDAALRAVAARARAAAGERGCAGRYGGEEFVVVRPSSSPSEAQWCAESLLVAIREIEVPGTDPPRHLSASVGAVWCPAAEAEGPLGLFALSDRCMYEAKRAGKDRCVFRVVGAADLADVPDDDTGPRVRGGPTIEDFHRASRALAEAGETGGELEPVPCVLHSLDGFSARARAEEACVHAIEAGSVRVLTGRPLVRGDLVELSIERGDEALYVAGVVTESNTVDETVHAASMRVFQRSHQPILSADPAAALRDLDWIATARAEAL